MKKVFQIIFTSVFLIGCGSEQPAVNVTVLPKENRPNFIIILADDLDQKLGTIEYMENLNTLLVEQGTTIEDFLITTPMCCPSRINLLRSQYTHSHQVYNNEAPHGGFPKFYETGEESSTLAVWLQTAGYRTALIGKYLNDYPLPDNRTYIPAGWSEWYSPARKNAYDGFDYYLNENGEIIPYPPTQENYFTDVLSRKSLDFIERATQDDIPFFLFLSPFVPHEPAVPAPRHIELLPNIQAPRTPSFNEADVSDKPYNLSSNPLLTEREIKRIDEIYRNRVLSMLAVDEMLAEVIRKLEDTHQLDNTYIIFTSEQGFHLGQHRMLQGKSSFYEEDIVVPFIVRGPTVPKNTQVHNLLAGIIDLAPTILDWAGVIPPEFVVGQSFTNILEGKQNSTNWRQVFFLETYAFSESEVSLDVKTNTNSLSFFSGLLPKIENNLPKWIGLRTLEYTYIEHPDGFIELYNLVNDPYQLENIAPVTDVSILNLFSKRLQELETCENETCSQLLAQPLIEQ
jgi:N-acetylglucosamine-6-sulfatase